MDNFFTFVCPSRTLIRDERARARGVVVEIGDGQTKEFFFTFVSPSRSLIRGERERARGVVGSGDGQTKEYFFHIRLSVSNTDPRRVVAGGRAVWLYG